jgi:hypothetical protein
VLFVEVPFQCISKLSDNYFYRIITETEKTSINGVNADGKKRGVFRNSMLRANIGGSSKVVTPQNDRGQTLN